MMYFSTTERTCSSRCASDTERTAPCEAVASQARSRCASEPGHPKHDCGSPEPFQKVIDPPTLAQAQTVLLLVLGMRCPVCTMCVRNRLLKLEGVLVVDVVLGCGIAAVRYDPQRVQPEALPTAVAATNDEAHRYTARLLVLPESGNL